MHSVVAQQRECLLLPVADKMAYRALKSLDTKTAILSAGTVVLFKAEGLQSLRGAGD